MPSKPLTFLHPASLLATWFGSGLLPGPAGTWGSLAALPVAWAILAVGGAEVLFAASLAAFAVGIWACGAYARTSGAKDPSDCVLDEVAGQWLTIAVVAFAMSPAPLTPLAWLSAFAAFRLFDITKPWPASWADQSLHGGLGIMLDDMIAGAYAGAAVILLGRFITL